MLKMAFCQAKIIVPSQGCSKSILLLAAKKEALSENRILQQGLFAIHRQIIR